MALPGRWGGGTAAGGGRRAVRRRGRRGGAGVAGTAWCVVGARAGAAGRGGRSLRPGLRRRLPARASTRVSLPSMATLLRAALQRRHAPRGHAPRAARAAGARVASLPRGWRGRRRRSVFREWRRCCAWRCNGATRVELRGGAGARVASLPRVGLQGRRDARALGVARAAGARVASLPRVALQVGCALRAAGVALRLRGVMAACVAGLQRVALQRRHPVVPSRGFGAAAAVVRRRRPPRRGGWPRGPAGPGAPRARAAPRGGACGRWRG